MTIVKATLRQLLRRKWKLPAAVVLCGVVLVAVYHAFHVTELRETFDEAVRMQPDSRSPAQSAALADWGRLSPFLMILDGLFLVGPLFVGLLMPGGVVANERRSGAIMLWAQHPMTLSRFYMQRYLGVQIATLAALALIGISGVLALTLPAGAIPSMDLLAESCLAGLLACAISFAISALGIRRAAFFGFAYYFFSNMTMSAQLSDTALGSWGVMPYLIFPTSPMHEFVTGFQSGVPWDWGGVVLVLYHFALWTAIAWLGLRRLERRPLKL